MDSASTESGRKAVGGEAIDRFRFEDFNRSELALDVIATMLGFNTQAQLDEEKRAAPDSSRLRELQEQSRKLLDEQRMIYHGNKDVMEACIEKYAPLIRSRFEVE